MAMSRVASSSRLFQRGVERQTGRILFPVDISTYCPTRGRPPHVCWGAPV
jgi:hypothetical protein